MKKKNELPKEEVNNENTGKFEDLNDLKKLVLYVIIVNFGQSDAIIHLLRKNHSSAQFIKVGEGTASKEIRDILSIEDNRKELVFSLLNEEYVEEVKTEMDAYFAASKRNAGVSFTLDVKSIVGVKIYKFLSQTVRG